MSEEKKYIKLEGIEIPVPCPMEWDNLQGGGEKRFCGECNKHVFDLSSLTRAEAEQLLTEKEGRVCVSYEQTADGRIKTADCAETFFAPRSAVRAAISLATGALVSAWAMLPANAQNAPGQTRRLMGKIAAPQNHNNNNGNNGVNNWNTTAPNSGGVTSGPTTTQPVPPRMTGGAVPIRMTGEVAPIVPANGTGNGNGNGNHNNGTNQIAPSTYEHLFSIPIETKLTIARNGKVQGLLFGQQLSLKHSGSAESQQTANWQRWYQSVQQLLFENWKLQAPADGQITVQITVKRGQQISISKMGVPQGGGGALDRDKFVGAVQSAVFSANHKPQLSMPSTSDNVEEVTFSATFGSGGNTFPEFAVTRL